MGLTVKGMDGSIRWAYHTAALIRAWTIEHGDQGYTLSATVVKSDIFRISQRPLVFIAPHVKGVWRWPVIELQISGASLTAKLGPRDT